MHERQQKAEYLRQKQAAKAKESQQKMKESTQERDVKNISLTEIDKVKTKVSQKQQKIKEEADKFFGEYK